MLHCIVFYCIVFYAPFSIASPQLLIICQLFFGIHSLLNVCPLQPAGVLVDLEDEVMPADSETVPHTGCLEIKILKGTDGRSYTLEAMRLTPRDANYVKVTLTVHYFHCSTHIKFSRLCGRDS